MSAYVNCGMIDPLRMARDATRISEKFVSEFCGFRESAHLWCLRNPGAYLDASRAVPAWARNQLRATAARAGGRILTGGADGCVDLWTAERHDDGAGQQLAAEIAQQITEAGVGSGPG